MGTYKYPEKVKLVIGFLTSDLKALERAKILLQPTLGSEEEVMKPISFTWTNYYESEIGTQPIRCFISYEKLIHREEIVEIKRLTNTLEDLLAVNNKRPVNIDRALIVDGK